MELTAQLTALANDLRNFDMSLHAEYTNELRRLNNLFGREKATEAIQDGRGADYIAFIARWRRKLDDAKTLNSQERDSAEYTRRAELARQEEERRQMDNAFDDGRRFQPDAGVVDNGRVSEPREQPAPEPSPDPHSGGSSYSGGGESSSYDSGSSGSSD